MRDSWNRSDSGITEFLSLKCDHIPSFISEWRKILCHKLHFFKLSEALNPNTE